ncbi:hypothetical protein OQA88_5491 [Cercophora sp. LCS_1]
MGVLREVIHSPRCELCSLVTAALAEAFGDIDSVPLQYQTPSGIFDENIALHFSAFVQGGGKIGPQLAFSSVSSLLIAAPSHKRHTPGATIAPRYSISIGLLASDFERLPNQIVGPAEALIPINLARADINKARDCFANCRATHGRICEIRRSNANYQTETELAILQHGPELRRPGLLNLLLIDIERMCITAGKPDCEYFALSYVWGRAPFLMLTKENESRLKEEFRLLDEDLPQVFRDAMEVTRIFGVGYLWIDALCIVQDDETRKREQLLQMDEIFESASLTIISADGTNARSGLTRLQPDTRRLSHNIPEFKDIGGLHFAPMPPPLDQVVTSSGLTWHTRGWTYQEGMLSKRVLVFTPHQIYYICNLASCSEGIEFIPGPATRREGVAAIQNHPLYCASDRHSFTARSQFRLRQHWFGYAYMIEDYSRRQFTYGSDILKALVGIVKAMTDPHVERYICGLPASFLEWSLLWQPTEALEYRGCTSSGLRFPSWSWIGWKGGVKMPHLLNPCQLTPTVTSWTFLTPPPDGILPSYTETEVRKLFIPYRPEFTPIEQGMPFQPTQWMTWRDLPAHLGAHNATYRDDPQAFMSRVSQHRENIDAMYPLIETGVLEFTTTSAVFEIESATLAYGYESFPRSTASSFAIRSARDWVGTIHLPLSLARERLKSERTEAEFILLSKTNKTHSTTADDGGRDRDIGQYTFNVNLFAPVDHNRPPALGNVMWIERREGLSYRVGVGQIHLEAWSRAQAKKTKVLLA